MTQDRGCNNGIVIELGQPLRLTITAKKNLSGNYPVLMKIEVGSLESNCNLKLVFNDNLSGQINVVGVKTLHLIKLFKGINQVNFEQSLHPLSLHFG